MPREKKISNDQEWNFWKRSQRMAPNTVYWMKRILRKCKKRMTSSMVFYLFVWYFELCTRNRVRVCGRTEPGPYSRQRSSSLGSVHYLIHVPLDTFSSTRVKKMPKKPLRREKFFVLIFFGSVFCERDLVSEDFYLFLYVLLFFSTV